MLPTLPLTARTVRLLKVRSLLFFLYFFYINTHTLILLIYSFDTDVETSGDVTDAATDSSDCMSFQGKISLILSVFLLHQYSHTHIINLFIWYRRRCIPLKLSGNFRNRDRSSIRFRRVRQSKIYSQRWEKNVISNIYTLSSP
jgi:hypothetical protein